MLGLLGHLVGWPMAEGGSQSIADALVSLLEAHGGGARVRPPGRGPSTSSRPPRSCCSTSPRGRWSPGRRPPARLATAAACSGIRYGPGVFKVDWALDGPIPWADPGLRPGGDRPPRAARSTRSRASEAEVQQGRHPERPVRAARPADAVRPVTRRRRGRTPAWAYCHVPERVDGRHDRPRSRRRSSGSRPGSATGSSPGT